MAKTNRNKIDKSELIDRLIYTVGALIIVIDVNGNIIKFNKKCEEMTGLKREDIEGKFIWALAETKNKTPQFEMLLEILLNSIISTKFESKSIIKDNEEYYILWNNTSIKNDDDEIIWTIGTGIDITEQKQIEKKLNILNNELEDRVQERTQQLQDVIDELQNTLTTLKQTQSELIQSKKMAALGSFVAGLAHEINTPLGIGVTAASYLSDETDKINNLFQDGEMRKSDLTKYIKTCNELSEMMLTNLIKASNFIKSFKQISVDQTNEAERIFYVNQYIDEIIMSLQPKLKKTEVKINIKCDEAIRIKSFPGAFSQIITNLILNSLLHGFEKNKTDNEKISGNITIEVLDNKTHLLVKYSDDGVGISPENLENIFDPFFTTKMGKGGSGLGLNILYNIVTKKFKGKITCDSELGNGVLFTFTIPINKEEQNGS